MKWPGPLEGGVTQSLINKFLECPLRFYIYAGLGLTDLRKPEPNLVWGDTCHIGLENLIEIPYQSIDFSDTDWEKIDKAVDEHMANEWPEAPANYAISIKNMLRLYDDSFKMEGKFETELKFQEPYTTRSGNKITLRGKVDGISGDVLVEHKCKGKIDANQTYLETPTDLQITIYAHVMNARRIIYDLIRIPDTQWSLPPRRKYERPSYYINSLYTERQWGDFPINQKKHLWIQQVDLHLTTEQIEKTLAETVDPIIDRLCLYYEYVSDPNFDWQNPDHYNHLFYRTPIRHFDPSRTQSYKCSYWDHLVGNIDLDDLVPIESYYPELSKKGSNDIT